MSTTPPPGPPPVPPSSPMPPPRVRSEKGQNEKEEEKQHEKDEKQREEKWRRDPLAAIAWACILIWAGVVLLANNLNLLPAIPGLPFLKEWSWIFAGAGIILLLVVLIRVILPEHRRGVIGSLILAFIFLGIGLGDSLGPGVIAGLALVAIGAALLIGGLLRR